MKTDYGLKWFKFYVKFLLLAGIAVRTLAILVFLVEYFDWLLDDPKLIAFFAVFIAVYIFQFLLYSNMQKRTLRGYYINTVFLFVAPLSMLLFFYVSTPWAPPDTFQYFYLVTFVVYYIVICLIWSLPNYTYFKRRKYLFGKTTPSLQTDSLSTNSQNENADTILNVQSASESSNETPCAPDVKIKCCKQCGAELLDGNKFCGNCGAKIE